MTAYTKIPQIEHNEASDELRELYDDILGTLRVPWVAFFCRTLALFPEYFTLGWEASKASLAARYTERAAGALREHALLPSTRPPSLMPKLEELGWDHEQVDEVRHVIDMFNYGNTKYVLMVTAWSEAFHGRSSGGADVSADDEAPLPFGVPQEAPALQLVDPNTASAAVQALFRRVGDSHVWHDVSSDYRTLANWPDFLELAFEDTIRPVVGSEEWDLTARRMFASARELVKGFPAPVGVSRNAVADIYGPREIAGLTGLLAMYQRFILDATMDTIRMKEALDGFEAVAVSPYSLT